MDVLYVVAVAVLWAAVAGLALACERLQARKGTS